MDKIQLMNLKDKDRVIGYLNYAAIPHVVEKIVIKKKETYNVWIFLEAVLKLHFSLFLKILS